MRIFSTFAVLLIFLCTGFEVNIPGLDLHVQMCFLTSENYLILDHCLKNGRYRLPWLDTLKAQIQESAIYTLL